MPNSIEQLSVKAAGTVKAVKAGFNGLRGVFLHLAEEHGEVGAMMKLVSKSKDAQFRREHYSKIRIELLSHERAELAEVYPPLRQQDGTLELAVLHEQEATQIESAVGAVDALDPTTEAWGLAFARLFALVQQHVEEEERDFFPAAQAAIGEPAAEALLKRYEAAKTAGKRQIR
ncbi:MAG TPA: hemerythrin domain-containing protein [Polyangiaceae bacterium]|nr:hemerythrin domain-containing protein [Polyangiaceae bacterium]